ncbi:MAG TPA: glucose 1-dehydrogenase [Caulobacteraceae bacterium]|jgi:NAD(P)-dependent dehydrogenase (short-subunit alcohol dehydrogenase family)|nr:glucose 1-dehydrogenase [Caulobacteraceae bacterium]
MSRLEGKVALVTGGASGIGAACAELLAAHGAAVAVTDLQDDKGAQVVAQIVAAGGRARYFHHDVTSEEAWVQVIGEVKAAFGSLDILVNNAGIGLGAPSITTMSLADFRRQQAVNVDGVFLGMKHGLIAMREFGNGGSIVNMSSVAGLKGSPTLAAYSATKGAVRLFTKAVALECGAAKDGVRVNSVHPGIIETPIWDGIGASTTGGGSNARPDLDALSQMAVPLGVKGSPRDIAEGVLWLASEEARYVTGAELVIDGGISIR